MMLEEHGQHACGDSTEPNPTKLPTAIGKGILSHVRMYHLCTLHMGPSKTFLFLDEKRAVQDQQSKRENVKTKENRRQLKKEKEGGLNFYFLFFAAG